MKKIFLTIITALLMCNQAFATEQVSFVYINGSNNNDVKMKNWFEKGVKKLHPVMKKNFEKYAYTDFLKNGEVTINNEPSMFFWGDKSRRDLRRSALLSLTKFAQCWQRFCTTQFGFRKTTTC